MGSSTAIPAISANLRPTGFFSRLMTLTILPQYVLSSNKREYRINPVFEGFRAVCGRSVSNPVLELLRLAGDPAEESFEVETACHWNNRRLHVRRELLV
jgi:hypothetical protein